MKKIILAFILSLCACAGYAQTPAFPTQDNYTNYYRFHSYLGVDSGFLLPQRDTLWSPSRPAIVFRPQDSSIYLFNGQKWWKIGQSSSTPTGVYLLASNFIDSLNNNRQTISRSGDSLYLTFGGSVSMAPDSTLYATRYWVSTQGFLTTEVEPKFTGSAAATISTTNINSWNNAFVNGSYNAATDTLKFTTAAGGTTPIYIPLVQPSLDTIYAKIATTYQKYQVDSIARGKLDTGNYASGTNTVSVTGNSAISVTGGVQPLSSNISFSLNPNNGQALWNANQIQGVTVQNTFPTTGQVLMYNGSTYNPTTLPTGSGTVTAIGVNSPYGLNVTSSTSNPITSAGSFGLTVDTTKLATIYYVNSHGGATPTLEQVTTAGNTTDKGLIVTGTSTFNNLSVGAVNVGVNPGSANTGMGQGVFGAASANNNTAFGYQALYYTTGNSNNAFGYQSLYSNTSGTNNSAFGVSTLNANTTGANNVAMGAGSLENNTSGGSNTGIGIFSLYHSTGSSNVGIGYQAGYTQAAASNNTLVGAAAGQYLTTGSNNVVIGFTALGAIGNTTNGGSVIIGYNANTGLSGATNEIVIGSQAVGHGNSTFTVGNNAIADDYFTGNMHISTPLDGAGNFLTYSSGEITSRTASEAVADLGTIGGVSVSTPTSGQILQYNGTNWINWTPNYIALSMNLSNANLRQTASTLRKYNINGGSLTFVDSTLLPVIPPFGNAYFSGNLNVIGGYSPYNTHYGNILTGSNGGSDTLDSRVVLTAFNLGTTVGSFMNKLTVDSMGLSFAAGASPTTVFNVNKNGQLFSSNYKNDVALDSVLSPDVNGNIKMRFLPVSGSYVNNTTTQQASSNFNISGYGVVGDSLFIGPPNYTGNMMKYIGGTYPQFLIGNQMPQIPPAGNYFMTSIANNGGILITTDTNASATDYGQGSMLIMNKMGYSSSSFSGMGMRVGNAGGSREMEVDVGYDMIDHTTDNGYSITRMYGINSSQGPSLEVALMGDSTAFTYGFHNYTNGMIWNPYRTDDYFLHLVTGSILLDAGNVSTQGVLTNIRVVTANYTVTNLDRTIVDNATSVITITLLTAAIAHNQEFKIANPSANAATLSIAVNALAGGTTTSVAPHTSMTIQSDGTNYWQTN